MRFNRPRHPVKYPLVGLERVLSDHVFNTRGGDWRPDDEDASIRLGWEYVRQMEVPFDPSHRAARPKTTPLSKYQVFRRLLDPSEAEIFAAASNFDEAQFWRARRSITRGYLGDLRQDVAAMRRDQQIRGVLSTSQAMVLQTEFLCFLAMMHCTVTLHAFYPRHAAAKIAAAVDRLPRFLPALGPVSAEV